MSAGERAAPDLHAVRAGGGLRNPDLDAVRNRVHGAELDGVARGGGIGGGLSRQGLPRHSRGGGQLDHCLFSRVDLDDLELGQLWIDARQQIASPVRELDVLRPRGRLEERRNADPLPEELLLGVLALGPARFRARDEPGGKALASLRAQCPRRLAGAHVGPERQTVEDQARDQRTGDRGRVDAGQVVKAPSSRSR